MKILGISGSVKGRKTLTAVNEVLKAIKEKDNNIETELLDPAQYDINSTISSTAKGEITVITMAIRAP